jgi:hypothetical protein
MDGPMNITAQHQEFETRYDIFEPGDLTALICVEEPEYQQHLVDQLSSLDYKIHVGLFPEDISLKLKTHVYDVVIIDETFGGVPLQNNQVLYEAIHLPGVQRRTQFLVLIGTTVMTNDEMMAFIYSVDLCFNVNDLANLKPVLRRGVTRQKEFFHVFIEEVRAAGLA